MKLLHSTTYKNHSCMCTPNGNKKKKQRKGSMIEVTHTIIDPWTVMIHFHDTPVKEIKSATDF